MVTVADLFLCIDVNPDRFHRSRASLRRPQWGSLRDGWHFFQTASGLAACMLAVNKITEEAKKMPHGKEREELLRKARQADTALRINDWLSSPGLKQPE